jgi:hypothetical protein
VIPALTALSAHASTIRIVRVAHIDFRARRLVRPRAVNKPGFDIRRERVKGLVDVDVALRRDLEEWDTELVRKRLSLLCGNSALLFPVALVADEDLVDALGGVLLYVGEPCADV